MAVPPPLRSATVWMALHAGAVFTAYAAAPDFELILRNDSRLYVKLARHTATADILYSIRTPGYPLFLRGIDSLCPGFTCLPEIQLALYCLAAVALCAALRRFGLSGWAAVAAASPLLYSPLVRYLAPSAMTDIPAAALALVSLSLLLVLVTGGRGRGAAWALLVPCLFLAYLVRPANVFLVALVPVAGLVLPALPGGSGWRPRARRLGAGLALASLVPLLLWCALRWVAVGHFGVVAFTGYNLVGITASVLTPEVIAELPDGERKLAGEILDRRRYRELEPVDAGSPFHRWRDAFILNSWRIAIPLARKTWREEFASSPETAPPRDLWVDRRLTWLSLALIRARPGLYLVWLLRAWGEALWLTASSLWVSGTSIAALLAVAARRRRVRNAGGRSGGGGRRESPAGGGQAEAGSAVGIGGSAAPRSAALSRSLAFLALAVGYYLLSLGLVLLVEPPEWRYLSATHLLLPGALAAVAVELWRDRAAAGAGVGGVGGA